MSSDAKPKRGPPFKPEAERRVQRSIRLKPHHWAKIDYAGKAELEALLERWRPPKEKPAE